MIPKVTHTVGSQHILCCINRMTSFEMKYQFSKNEYISWIHIYNVIVLNNINGDCLIATSKSVSLECVVSDCVNVFKRVSKMAIR